MLPVGEDAEPQPYEQAYRRMLAAIRDGTLAREQDHDELELGHRFGAGPTELRGALYRLTYLGLARRTGATTVRIESLAPERWAEGSWAVLDLLEIAVRATVPEMTDEQVARHGELVAAAGRDARLRSDALDTSMLATVAFWADETPNHFVGRLLHRVLEQYRYGLEPSPRWRVAGIDRWLAASAQAVQLGDPVSAQQAVHVLARIWPEHLRDVAVARGMDDPDALRAPAPATDATVLVDDEPDPAWFDLLGAVRDGTWAPGEVVTTARLARQFRVPVARLVPMLRRLELTRLVRAVPGTDDAVVVHTPDLRDWSDSVQLATGMFEAAFRQRVTDLSDADAEVVLASLRRIGQLGRARDYGYVVALLSFARSCIDGLRNSFLRDSGRIAMDRTAYIMERQTPFRQWELDDFLAMAADAVRARDPGLATEAMHAYGRHIDVHVAEVRARYGTMER
ncbi:hypothetical protein ACLBWP_14725 [Microbacterium sp. M1A1_1b]